MPEITKKEPGRADVQERERGDPRQHDHPIDKNQKTPNDTAQDRPPATRGGDSPWMGGG